MMTFLKANSYANEQKSKQWRKLTTVHIITYSSAAAANWRISPPLV